MAEIDKNPHLERPTTLLTFEIGNYGALVEGQGVMHRWIVVETGQPYHDLLVPKDKPFLYEKEDEDIHLQAMLDQAGEVEYEGTISVEQALGEIALRRQALNHQTADYMEAAQGGGRSTQTVVIKGNIL